MNNNLDVNSLSAVDISVADSPDVSKAWIITYTGLKFYHLNPRPEMVCIEDIAHALSLTCRWTGHTRFHYSVAQHSVCASLICPPEFALDALMHDSSETYLGDMNRPLKHFTAAGPAYLEIEEKVEKVIFEKFGVRFPLPEAVKDADTQMLYAEKAQLMTVTEDTKYEARKWNRDETEANIRIEKWTPRRAEKMFLERFASLYKEK
jgi:5'-deoxynucleotidase YfbR-like HD superfamily hydrolase